MTDQYIFSHEGQERGMRSEDIDIITRAICGKKNLVDIAEAILDLGYRRVVGQLTEK